MKILKNIYIQWLRGHVGPKKGPNIGPRNGLNIRPKKGPNIGPRKGLNIGPKKGPNIGPRKGPIWTCQIIPGVGLKRY